MSRALVAFLGVLVLAGASCAGPSYKPGQRPEMRVAADIAHGELRFKGFEGVKLFAQVWRPKPRTIPIRGVLAIVHGLKDHGDRYNVFASSLARAGYVVFAMDLRGHGDSEGDRVYLGSFDDYLEDLKAFLTQVGEESGFHDAPVFLMGHSMGGAIVTRFVLREHPKIAGVILSAPALKRPEDVPGIKVFFTRMFSFFAPRLALFSLDDEDFSSDPKVVEDMKKDPLIYHGAAPVKTAKELLNAMSDIDESMEKFDYPVLALHGTKDKLTNPDGSRELIKRASSKDKTLKIYEDYFHDLLHEPSHAAVQTPVTTEPWPVNLVATDIRWWLDKRTR